MKMSRYLSIFLLATAVIMLFSNCERNQGEIIPYVRVDIYKDIYTDLAMLGPLQSIIMTGGVNGIILFRDSENNYQAYDRTCTLWPEHDAAVIPDVNFDGVYQCPECESQYLVLNDGQVINGPARYSLVAYRTVLTGSILHIFN